MKIESVAEALLEEAEEEAKSIVRKAQLEANDAIKKEKEELVRKRESEIAAYERAVGKMMEERIAAARLDAKKDVQRAKDAVVSEVVEMVLKKLIELRKDKARYKEVLASFYRRAAEELGSSREGFEIECANEDVAIVKSIIEKGDSVKANDSVDGGIIVRARKGGVMIDMTFRTIVKDREGEIKALAYEKLFK